MNKSRKLVALALATSMMLGGTLTAFAQDVSLTDGSGTGTTPTTFTTTADMLEGGDLVVSIPDALTLSQNEGKTAFEASNNVSAKGNINPAKKVVVTTPTNTTYTHVDDVSVTADGTVTFGITDGVNQKTEWSASELHTGGATGVAKPITANVPMSEVEYIGDYNSSVIFTIELQDKKEKVAGVYNADGELLADWATLETNGLDLSKGVEDPYNSTTILRSVLDSLGYLDAATEVIVPDTETIIGESALSELPNVETITLPNTVTYIGYYSLSQNPKLIEVNLPDSITELGYAVFSGDPLLKTINIPSSVTTLSENVFANLQTPDGYSSINSCGFTSVTYKGNTYTNSTDVENALVGNVTNYGKGPFNIEEVNLWGTPIDGKVRTWGN